MSTYWFVHCKTCKKSSETDINRGQEIFRDMYAAWPFLKQAWDVCTTDYLEFSIMAHGSELFSFLSEHDGHELQLQNEYGRWTSWTHGDTEEHQITDG